MSDALTNKDSPTKMDGQSKKSHWCEFTKTWPYPEICITCGGVAPELYDSDTSSDGDTNETTTDNPVITDTAKNEKVYAAVRSKPFPVITDTAKSEKVYAAVRSEPFVIKTVKKRKGVPPKKPKVSTAGRSKPFVVKAANKRKVVPSKKPKKATMTDAEMEEFYKKLFKDYPLFLPPSPPFSDGQINEFLCRHCGRHQDLDDEAWDACPYAIFHGLVKDESDHLGDQSSVSSNSPNPEPKKSEEKSNRKENE